MSDNPVADASRYEEWKNSQPFRCHECGEIITDGYEYDGEYYCKDCILEKLWVDLSE